MTKRDVDGLLLKHVFREDIDKPPKWYYENFWLQTLLCNSWFGLGLMAEEMFRRDWIPTISHTGPNDENKWYATFHNWSNEPPYGEPPCYVVGIASTPFMAVAFAALRAVGVEIPEEEVPK